MSRKKALVPVFDELHRKYSKADLCGKYPDLVHQPAPREAVLKIPAAVRRRILARMILR